METKAENFTVADLKKIWSFEKDEQGNLCITEYKGNDVCVVIPERIGQNIVTKIGYEAFSPRKYGRRNKVCDSLCKIQSVTIPATIETIDDRAFKGCYNLESVIMSDGVVNIGASAFELCNKLKTISIPESVESIGKEAFLECIELNNLRLPDKPITIGDNAFTHCYGLADEGDFVIIKNKLYNYFGNRESVVIPNGVRTISDNIFMRALNKPYKIAMTLANLDLLSKPFECYTKDIIIPDSVETIDKYAFWGSEAPVIHAHTGSYAEQYAKENNIPFVAE